MDFAQIILSRLDELGLNINQAEARFGLPQGFIRGVVRDDAKRATPSIQKAKTIADAMGIEFYIGPKRDHGMSQTVSLSSSAGDTANFVDVPLHEALLSAGAGASSNEAVIDRLAFRRDWLARIGLAPSAARMARVVGDSMEPTLFEGDMVLIDTSSIEPRVVQRSARDRRRSPIYALADGTGARIKRIERPDVDQIMLLSDNPDYPPEFVRGHDLTELKIIGKVAWWGHTVRDI